MLEWVNSHGVELMILNFIYNSAMQAMPPIDEHCGKLYVFAYRFGHGLAGNWGLVKKPSC
jgi:hypothetical protein